MGSRERRATTTEERASETRSTFPAVGKAFPYEEWNMIEIPALPYDTARLVSMETVHVERFFKLERFFHANS